MYGDGIERFRRAAFVLGAGSVRAKKSTGWDEIGGLGGLQKIFGPSGDFLKK